MNCVVVVLDVATNGIWTRLCSPFVEKNISSGEQWIRTVTCSTFWSRADATKKLLNASFASSSKDCNTFLA